MANGKIEQLDQPEEIYSNPNTVFAATFVGNSNQFNGVVESASEGICKAGDYTISTSRLGHLHNGDRVLIIVRPEEVSLLPDTGIGTVPSTNGTEQGNNLVAGIIELRTFLGPFTRFHVLINDSTTLTADIPNHLSKSFEVGHKVQLSFSPDDCQVLPIDSRGHELRQLAEAEKV